MQPGEALLLYPCRTVHTFFMRFPVDVVFLSGKGEAVRIEKGVPPWRMVEPERRACAVLELPAGTVDRAGIGVGQVLIGGPRSPRGRLEEKGQVLVEFALALPLFLLFVFGIFSAGYWGLGSMFVQDAAYEAARRYAVTLDPDRAASYAMHPISRWGCVFLDPSTCRVEVDYSREAGKAHARVAVEPRIKDFYIFRMPQIRREASCVLEYRFRHPEEFVGL